MKSASIFVYARIVRTTNGSSLIYSKDSLGDESPQAKERQEKFKTGHLSDYDHLYVRNVSCGDFDSDRHMSRQFW